VTGQQHAASPGRLVFVGAVHEAEPALAALLDSPAEVAEVITVPREHRPRPSGYVDLEPLATRHRVPVRRCADINAAENVEHIRWLAPDLIVVVGWTRLLGADLLAIPRSGCVGFHASLLPRYRGRAPVNWVILRGEDHVGNTMLYLDAGTDSGDVIDQRRGAVGPDDSCATVYARVADAGAAMLRDHLPAILAGTAPRRPQGPASGEILRKRTPQMGITDWNRPARAVHDWIRALTEPYPGAFAFWSGRKVMLWASANPGTPGLAGRPGEVLGCDEHGLRVATADASLLVTALSEQGSPPQPALAWAHRSGICPGDRFDEVDEATARWVLGLGAAEVGPPCGSHETPSSARTLTTSCWGPAAPWPGTSRPGMRFMRSSSPTERAAAIRTR
jgi:methionyl-tRNA formyltransferase